MPLDKLKKVLAEIVPPVVPKKKVERPKPKRNDTEKDVT